MFHQEEKFLKLRGMTASSNNTYIYATPVSAGQRKVQFCTLLQVPVWMYGDSSNGNSFTLSVQSWENSWNVWPAAATFAESGYIKYYWLPYFSEAYVDKTKPTF